MSIAIRIHPDNSKIFEFRGQPYMLVCATEHYGAVINRPFQFEKYLADAAEKKQTLSRLFMLFRELQHPINPYSTCKPESPDFISPFKRTGPGKALDGQPKFDLDQWNPEFFERLHRFLSLASDYGVIVEVTFLSNTYNTTMWELNPLNAANNVNDTETIEWMDYTTMRHPKLFARQLSHVRKIVEETNKYDNIIYEVCNEPGSAFEANPAYPTAREVNDWQSAIIRTIRETEATLPNKHLIAGQEAFTYTPWEQSSDLTFRDLDFDVVNMHPLPNTTYAGRGYEMGAFMSKELKLREYRDYCLVTTAERKPLNLDEDNVASQYKDYDGWTIHRKRAWTALLCGCHYDYIDFSIINYCETGTPASQKHIRSWMKNLSEFVHSLDLAHARPSTGIVKALPQHAIDAAVLAVDGCDYSIYLADERELEDGEGGVINGSITVDLPPGAYRTSLYSPETGLYSPAITTAGGPGSVVQLSDFRHDIVVRLIRQ